MLADFNLLNLFPQAGTVTGAILSNDANLLRPLRLRTLRFPLEGGRAPPEGAAAASTRHRGAVVYALRCGSPRRHGAAEGAADRASNAACQGRTMASPAEALYKGEREGCKSAASMILSNPPCMFLEQETVDAKRYVQPG